MKAELQGGEKLTFDDAGEMLEPAMPNLSGPLK
jgi:hypothetical protein